MRKIFICLSFVFSVLLVSSCQKDKMLEGTWARVLPETFRYFDAKYEFAVFDGNGTVTVWIETAERVKLNQHVYKYTVVGGTHIFFSDYDLWYRTDGVLDGNCGGESVAFFRQ